MLDRIASRFGLFQSSPVPKDGCNPGNDEAWAKAYDVSILTRPEGRVQPAVGGRASGVIASFNPHPSRRTGATASDAACASRRREVSILTRPEGRVQQVPPVLAHAAIEFQSSPVPKDGCNCTSCSGRCSCASFQSSPVPKDGCNLRQSSLSRWM